MDQHGGNTGGAARDALDLWRALAARQVRADGPDLSARQTAILLTIHLDPGPHTVRGLAAEMGLGKPAVVRALDTLEALSLVRRIPDPADRRNVFLAPTDEGRERLGVLGASMAKDAAGLLGRQRIIEAQAA